MKLVPEQIKVIQEKLEQSKLKLKEYENYFSELSPVNGDNNYPVHDGGDRLTKTQYHLLKQQIQEYKNALKNAERITEINTEQIGLGTKFTLQFDGEEEKERFILADTGLGITEQYISLNSEVGIAILNLTEGERFDISLQNGQKVSGLVTSIITDQKEYPINYIRKRKYSSRKSTLYKPTEERYLTDSQIELLEIEQENLKRKLAMEKNKENQIMDGTKITIKIGKEEPRTYTVVDKDEKEIDSDKEIGLDSTLLEKIAKRKSDDSFIIVKTEKNKPKKISAKVLEINQNNLLHNKERTILLRQLSSRINTITNILQTAKRVNPKDNQEKVGYGSHVSIMIFTKDGVKTRRSEIIQKAVSYELSTDYIEACSPLGVKIMGLTNNSEFVYRTQYESYSGIIYDIDNHEKANKTTNPMIYQKYIKNNRK